MGEITDRASFKKLLAEYTRLGDPNKLGKKLLHLGVIEYIFNGYEVRRVKPDFSYWVRSLPEHVRQDILSAPYEGGE